MKDLHLMKASRADAKLLFVWANDPETRKNAFHTERISYETHIGWLDSKLKDENCILYICKSKDENIGQIRLERDKDNVIISYSVGREHRGFGYGTEMLRLIEGAARKEPTMREARFFIGYVKPENLASQKCFEKNGFARIVQKDCIQYSKALR